VSASTRSSQVDVRVYRNVRLKDILCRTYIKVEKEREKDGDAFINRGDREREEERWGERERKRKRERMETLQSAMYPDYD